MQAHVVTKPELNNKKSSYLTTYGTCQFGRYRFTRLPYGLVLAGDMFQHKKMNEMFKDIPNVFGIAEDIFIVGYDADGRFHEKTLRQVMEICH